MRRTATALVSVSATVLLFFVPASRAAEAEGPAWSIQSMATPTNFKPADITNPYFYSITATNSGGKPTDGAPIIITDTLPEGLLVSSTKLVLSYEADQVNGFKDFGSAAGASTLCEVEEGSGPAIVTCEIPQKFQPPLVETNDTPSVLHPFEAIVLRIFVRPVAVSEGQTLSNAATVEGGGALPAATSVDNMASLEPAPRGLAFRALTADGAGQAMSQAAAHPFQYTTGFVLDTNPGPPGGSPVVPSGGDAKDIGVALPAGLVGNPTVVPRCTAAQFTTLRSHTSENGKGVHIDGTVNECPDGSAVGFVFVQQVEGIAAGPVPLYNLVPPPGEPAQLGFQVSTIPFYLDSTVRSGGDYGINSVLHNNSQVKRIVAATVTVWGIPADPRHDRLRGSCLNPVTSPGQWSFEECPAGVATLRPFFRMPTSCIEPLRSVFSYSTWSQPDSFLSQGFDEQVPAGCNQVEFDPTLEARPTTDVADSPSGLHVDLHIPQKENESPGGRGQADLRDTVVTLPKGLVVNPSSANGLGSCTSAQVGYRAGTSAPMEFTPDPAQCPPSSRIGTVELNVPAVDHPIKGGVYVATPHDNPFGSLLALYIAVDDPTSGVVVKLAGEVHADPQTGQLTTTFAGTPQQPFEDFHLEFFGGAGAALRTPAVCGTYSTTSSLTPWSAPESGPPATPSDTYSITREPGGGGCPSAGGGESNSPGFDAGTLAPIARAYSPFVMRLRREDGSQEFSSVSATLPPGLLGKLAGIPYCPEAAMTAAEAKSGRVEQASPSCPAASQLGTVTVGAGAGPAPYYTNGRLYLAGPYKGAPLSLVAITPAAAGPYDLGTVVSRVAVHVDPETARITAISDPIPHILQGIPLDVRSIVVNVDRADFTLNPTNCDPMTAGGEVTSVFGQIAPLSSPFQVGECSGLAFKPKLSFALTGKPNRGAHPALKAVLRMPEGGANIAKAVVTLPHSEFIDQGHFRTICTRVQYAQGACPAGSIYGFARAASPLLEKPLEGPVYLRSSSHELPDLVISLDGQVHFDAVGHVDSVNGGLRTTFEAVPDAPVTSLVLKMQGGKKGLFVNSTNICAKNYRATVEFDAQNGKVADSRAPMKAKCKGKGRKGGKGGHKRSSR